jgi:hypothetical protein
MADSKFLKSTINLHGANNYLDKSQVLTYRTILLFLSLLIAVHFEYRSPGFPFTADSAAYIEQARNMVSSGSTLVTPYGLTPANEDQIENKLFPIGFSIAIAAVSLFGVDAKDAAIGIGQFSTIVLPWLLYFCFRNALGTVYAMILAALSLMSPGILINSPMGLTDLFTLAITASSIGLIINAQSRWCFVLAGILAGTAYSVRNAQLALLLTILLYFCYLRFASNIDDRRAIYVQAVSCIAGMSVIVIPLLLSNLFQFGSINPYEMPHSTIGFIENLRTYIQVFLRDVSACSECATYLAWSIPGLLLLTTVVGYTSWGFYRYKWSYLDVARKKTIVISAIYVVVGSCIVIMARTRYQWGEVINLRHTLQYTPFMLFILLSVTMGQSKWMKVIRWTIVAFMFFSHLRYAFLTDFTVRNRDYPILLSAFNTGKSHLCIYDKDIFLVSNWETVFRIECGASVRNSNHINKLRNNDILKLTENNEGYSSLMDAISDIKIKSMDRPTNIGFFPGAFGLIASDFPISIADQKELLEDGWSIIRNDKSGLLIKHPKDNILHKINSQLIKDPLT